MARSLITERMLALVVKDLYLYRWQVGLCWIGATAFSCVLLTKMPPQSRDRALFFFCALDCAFMVVFGDWLSYFERSKGTFSWIRTLPVSDRLVVSAKFAANVVIQVGVFFLPISFSAPQFLERVRVEWTVTAWLSLVAISSFMLLTKLAFGQRFGQIIPLAVVFLFMVGSIPIRNRFPLLWAGISEFVWRPRALIPLELVIIAGLWYLMCKWVAAKDTPQLVD
ncbi:MAG: ABC-2 transporter permease [Acidobacteriota bacterium]